jgi:flagellar motility protein MotE (MotC chaperone)
MMPKIPMLRMPVPRLLPATITLMGGLLAAKSVTLALQGVALIAPPAGPAMVSSAFAAGDRTAGKTGAATAAAHGAAPAAPNPPASGAAAKPAPAAEPIQPSPPAISDGERTVLLELRRRREELDSRELGVAARESVLAAAEQKLGARIGELQTLQKRLEALEAARQQREDASWQGLVKLYETMKPREAAAIFNELAMPVLLQVIDRMKEAKAAPVLSAMHPDKAREVTAELAKLRTRRDQPLEPQAAGAGSSPVPPRPS